VQSNLSRVKQGKMAVPPFTFTTFDKPIFDESGKPTFNVQTLKKMDLPSSGSLMSSSSSTAAALAGSSMCKVI
jgi:hypothetical protein